jgi:hypothetical protein
MGWWTEYAIRNSSICGQNFLIEIAVFRDGGSIKVAVLFFLDYRLVQICFYSNSFVRATPPGLLSAGICKLRKNCLQEPRQQAF